MTFFAAAGKLAATSRTDETVSDVSLALNVFHCRFDAPSVEYLPSQYAWSLSMAQICAGEPAYESTLLNFLPICSSKAIRNCATRAATFGDS